MIVDHLPGQHISGAAPAMIADARPIGERHPTAEQVHVATGVKPSHVETTNHPDGGKT
eukprot:CAMPEP_0116572654 /NCGR_PEP_ID=MMETSP0397-20121206/18302_1 /TAXON_ID=216820 /ORGANISM="Cyclophora tenuis, Strain ECT3854" /LENGTH=57 /DNA_ID=CAMNT_0004101019 /DNA_START=1 /DNA_END=170 /DNA_ORIENTATION=+